MYSGSQATKSAKLNRVEQVGNARADKHNIGIKSCSVSQT